MSNKAQETTDICEMGAQNMAHAIIKQAAMDYKAAYKSKNIKALAEIEAFFMGEDYIMYRGFTNLGDISGKIAIKKLKEQCTKQYKKTCAHCK